MLKLIAHREAFYKKKEYLKAFICDCLQNGV